MANLFLPEHCKIVDAVPGITDTFAEVTLDYVSLKNCQMAWIVILLTQVAGHQTLLTPLVATSVAPAGSTAITFTTDIWANEDTGASDTLVKQTNATTYEVLGDIATKMVVIRMDPADIVAQGSTYDCISCTIESSKQLNLLAALYVLQERYPQETPPAAIVD